MAVLVALAPGGCDKTASAPPTVSAPVVTVPATTAQGGTAMTPSPPRPYGDIADASAAPSGEGDRPAARFRQCETDADCVAVDRVGCCHNGWKEAVASAQAAAYAASFTCPDAHPICAMYIVRDDRLPRCDGKTHLCTMTAR